MVSASESSSSLLQEGVDMWSDARVRTGSVVVCFSALKKVMCLVMERWLFFAVARHAVGLYYGGDEALVPAE